MEPSRPTFFRGLALDPELQRKLVTKVRTMSSTLRKLSFGEKWKYVPPEKDGVQFCKDTSNMTASYRLARVVTTLACTDYELRHVLQHSSTEGYRTSLKKILGKPLVDAMVLKDLLDQRDPSVTFTEQDLTDPLELTGRFEESMAFMIKLMEKPQVLEQHPFVDPDRLNALFQIASEGKFKVFTPSLENEALYWEMLDVISTTFSPVEAKIECLRILTRHFPEWSSRAQDLFKFPLPQQDEEAVALKWGVMETGVKSKCDFCIVDHFGSAKLDDAQGQQVGFWAFHSTEGHEVGCMPLQTAHGIRRVKLLRMGIFWKPADTPGHLELTVCASIKSDYARNIMTRVVTTLGRLQEAIEDIRINSHGFAKRGDWVNDAERKGCCLCMRNFHSWRRKHHCRMCGEVICSDCSILRQIKLAVVGSSKLRLCKACVSSAKRTPVAMDQIRVIDRSASTINLRSKADSLTSSNTEFRQSVPCDNVVMSDALTYRDSEFRMKMSPYSGDSGSTSCSKKDGVRSLESEFGRLSTADGDIFDSINELACQALACPLACVCIHNQHHDYAKLANGANDPKLVQEVHAFAESAMSDTAIVILDAEKDQQSRYFANISPRIRFYAGCPIIGPHGEQAGYLCVADTYPRSSLGQESIFTMERLATLTVRALEERRDSLKTKVIYPLQPEENYTPSSMPMAKSPLLDRNEPVTNAHDQLRHLLNRSYATHRMAQAQNQEFQQSPISRTK